MNDKERKIDGDGVANPKQGNESPIGTGTHATNVRKAEAETADNKAKGNAARLGGYGKGNTHPESGKN